MEQNKNQLIPINNSLASFERQISIGEKLLGLKLSDYEKETIRNFLAEIVLKYFRFHISEYYPLSEKLIDKYQDILSWSGLIANENILIPEWSEWSENLILKYKDKLVGENVWTSLSLKSFWTISLIEKYKENIDWEYFSGNGKISWNEEVIDKYIEKWDWTFLSQNINLFWTSKIINKYVEYWNWESLSRSFNFDCKLELIERYLDKWDWNLISKNSRFPWNLELIEKFSKYIYWENRIYLYENIEIEESLIEIENYLTSSNIKDSDILEFSTEYNGRGFDYIPILTKSKLLDYLSGNHKMNWTDELIEKYENKWNWKKISINPKIHWSSVLIEKYSSKIDWKLICLNNIPWNIQLIKKFEFSVNWESLSSNPIFYDNHLNIEYYADHLKNDCIFFNKDANKYIENLDEWTKKRYYQIHSEKIKKFKLDQNYILKNKTLVDWKILSKNQSFEWSVNFINLFIDYWDWKLLSSNKSVVTNIEIFMHFKDKWEYNSSRWELRSVIRDYMIEYITDADIIKILEKFKSSQ
ncbi:hypothetical protein J2X31_001931 [Flavobacterium arsenatis]|uniref:Uncharacterized protein n=1 Tax=Flavobacterium arsenatis TaxID=1484332 RepID=A0ABU1TQ31_9FLAO|nr:hypothetical protein [Flavobacterium arsenatis]MDR6967917.1 hypothetical protein [Flavobacterium arsenatis]